MKNILAFIVMLLMVLAVGCSSDDNPSSGLPPAPPGDTGGGGGSGSGGSGGGDTTPPREPPPPNDTSGAKGTWDLPREDIISGCLGRDCIPALENPALVGLNETALLKDDDWVFGVVVDGDARAYPHPLLDWHEVINQDFGEVQLSITYCPLTGSGVGINLNFDEELTSLDLNSFGVSGFLYNNNLIAYDRSTGSNWSQMLMECVNGSLRGTPMPVVPLMETRWKTWKKMYPNSRVVSENTGIDRPYGNFPYGNYREVEGTLFPVTHEDRRLFGKERVHTIISNVAAREAKAYRFRTFEGGKAVNDDVGGMKVVVAGSKEDDFYVSFIRTTKVDRVDLTFEVDMSNPQVYPFNLIDNEGNTWNIFGEAISGPRTGERLRPTRSYNAYWFAVGAIFPGLPIYDN